MRRIIFLCIWFVFYFHAVEAQSRREIDIPNIPGYLTLKGDFHVQTVFSDGEVWPTVRVNEAWENGLDVLAITDHVEYRPNLSEAKFDHNQSYEIAKPLADQLGLILVRGAEMSFNSVPDHLNAIFIKNANLLVRDSWAEALQECKDQDAFVFLDPQGTERQPPGTTNWWQQYQKRFPPGTIGGIEIFNGRNFAPDALRWGIKNGMTLLANSNVKGPLDRTYPPEADSRPVTLVFATERKAESVLYALRNKRTALFFEGKLIGDARFLRPIFSGSVKIVGPALNLGNNESKFLQVHNSSDIDFSLIQRQTAVGFGYQEEVTLKAHRTTLIEVVGKSDEIKNQPVLSLEYEVSNLITGSGEKLRVVIEADNQ
jgi:hypothetical protein